MLLCWYWYCLFGWIIFLCFVLQIWNVICLCQLEHSEVFLDLLSLRFYIKICFSASSAIHNKTPAHAATTSKRTKTPKTMNQKGKTTFTVTKVIMKREFSQLSFLMTSDCRLEKYLKRSYCCLDYNLLYSIQLHEKLLQFDWLRAVVFQLNLKCLLVKITNLLSVVVV